jgi:hypothetical protein
MAKQTINLGTSPNDRRGAPLRIAFQKVNENFTEVYGEIDSITIPDVSEFITADDLPPIPSDISELTDEQGSLGQGGESSTSLPFVVLTNSAFIFLDPELDEEVSFTKIDGATGNTAIDFIDTGLSITRGNQGGLYNAETEQWFNSDSSPEGTLWNADGWEDLKDFRRREYVSFRESLNNRIGELILDAELIMWDTINDKYYTFKFSQWKQGGNGGGFSYVRRLINDLNFFRKTDYGSEIDVFVADDPGDSGIAITRGNNQGIFNPFRENGWSSGVSPDGTLWNANGWSNLKDIESRSYINFYDAVGQDLGENVPNRELIMFIPDTNQYFAIKFLSWTRNNNGGGFSYLRYEIDLDQLDEGIIFADGTVQKSAYIETNVLSRAPNKRRIETRDGFARVQLTELVTGDTFSSAIYQTSSNTSFIQVNTTPELVAIYSSNNTDIQISFDEMTWINGRVNGFASQPVLRYYIDLDDDFRVDVTAEQVIYVRSRSGAEPVRWFRADGDNFRGAVINFHAYASESGTIVGTIHIIRDSGERNIVHTEVKSGNQSKLEDLDLWDRRNNEREIWVKRTDGQAETISVHWYAKFFYGTEYWD